MSAFPRACRGQAEKYLKPRFSVKSSRLVVFEVFLRKDRPKRHLFTQSPQSSD